ncbi:Hop family outer membrane protein HopJ/HopK [Helicobacter pylori]|uniref:Hop family outer membrane protein HopJ/HopK n=1 Tax=Helicobacter pylori TaxID=210 RepID=UPI001FD4CF04|nr:Hop family outer membrane protein HopJ/HopK [Helicobacter pylori]UOR97012.1 Hop family outer membrane protein HopJ/HopK [Helicobacter pylori]UOR97955.1 Hop family outer membrane protein HopJ/HopK [Helicobacter pylori]
MQKTLFSLSLFSSLFLSFCIAEENGAYASVGFEYSISHAIQHNNPFLNQERIQIISNAQNKIDKLNQVKNEITSMPNTFAYINNNLKNHSKLTPTEMQAEKYYLQSTLKNIEKIVMLSGGVASNPKLVQTLEKIQEPTTNPLEFEENLKNLEVQFAQSQNRMLSSLSSQIAQISNSLNALDPSSYSKNISNMYGVTLNVGYKHFFTKKKNQGFRYYLFYDYGYTDFGFVGNGFDGLGKMNNHLYGLGIDYLYNFIDNAQKHSSVGFYAGFALAGSSWVGSGLSMWVSETDFINHYLTGYQAKMHTSFFQIPLNFGIRVNVDRHNGFEMGLKIPLAVNSFYETHGKGLNTSLFFKRLVVFNVSYVYSF